MYCMCAFRHSDADGPAEKDAEGEAYHSGRVIQYCNSGVIRWSEEWYNFS